MTSHHDEVAPAEIDRKAWILSAAIEEFARSGFAAARVDRIARAAGVNRQLIYHYYESKAGLWRAVLQTMVDAYRPFWQAVSESSLDDLLDGVPTAGANSRWASWRRILAWEGVEYHQENTDIVLEEVRTAAYQTQTDVLRREQASGRLSDSLDAEALSMLLTCVRLGPMVLPQITQMVMGQDVSAGELAERLSGTLHALLDAQEVASKTRR